MAHVVVVTGANAGAGRATVREFAGRGCDVGLIARDYDRLEAATANQIEQELGFSDYGAHGRFSSRTRIDGWTMFTSRHPDALARTVAVGLLATGRLLLPGRLKV